MVRVKWARWAILALALLVVGGLTWAFLRPGNNGPLEVADGKAKDGAAGKASSEEGQEEYVTIGGIKRRKSDLESPKSFGLDENALAEASQKLKYGTLPEVPADKNPQVESVVEALREQRAPERLSVLSRPRAFNLEAFKANPGEYLNVVEPSRVFQSAKPGPGVARLRSLTPGIREITQGESVTLRVSAPAGAPVTFTSFDAGAFDNDLTSITVQADATGIAEAKFVATPGTIQDVHILAGSPLASGQARFVVNIVLPEVAAADAVKPAGS